VLSFDRLLKAEKLMAAARLNSCLGCSNSATDFSIPVNHHKDGAHWMKPKQTKNGDDVAIARFRRQAHCRGSRNLLLAEAMNLNRTQEKGCVWGVGA
jgi:hypothetical protein